MGIKGDWAALTAFTKKIAGAENLGPQIAARAAPKVAEVIAADGRTAEVTATDSTIHIEATGRRRRGEAPWMPSEDGMPPKWNDAIDAATEEVMDELGAVRK